MAWWATPTVTGATCYCTPPTRWATCATRAVRRHGSHRGRHSPLRPCAPFSLTAALQCVCGTGATVELSCSRTDVRTSVVDHGDGTYELAWRSRSCGTSEVGVTIGGAHIAGSPCKMKMHATRPDLAKTVRRQQRLNTLAARAAAALVAAARTAWQFVPRYSSRQLVASSVNRAASRRLRRCEQVIDGEGIRNAHAGKDSRFVCHFFDGYANTATPGSEVRLGLALVSEATKKAGTVPELSTVQSHPFTSTVVSKGEVEVTYIATAAGGNELHIWCDLLSSVDDASAADSAAERPLKRVMLLGSPFALSVFSGKGHLSNSEVSGYVRDAESLEKPGGKHNPRLLPEYQEDLQTILVGDTLLIRPKILDEYGNPAKLPDGALSVSHQLPDGSTEPVLVVPQTRGGLTTYS